MRTVKEVSKLMGVSVRTLHHYDAIGLLLPTKVSEAGYRLYDDAALSRLQTILLFRELQFPLREIKAILDSPDFDPTEALTQQIQWLELQYKRLGKLIAFAREIQQKGVNAMEYPVFDNSEMEQYRAEARAKWGTTQAYRDYAQRQTSDQQDAAAASQLMRLFAELGELRHLPPADAHVQQKIAALQACISQNFYTCTTEIFRTLGQMYGEDARFVQTIDAAGGAGTAALAAQAIAIYCSTPQP